MSSSKWVSNHRVWNQTSGCVIKVTIGNWEYVAVYVDNLLIASKTPQDIVDTLEKVHQFKLKGSGPTSFYLGCDFFRDKDRVLCYAPKKYIIWMLGTYQRIFDKPPKQVITPLDKGDHPELDTSDLFEVNDIKIYQLLIGTLQFFLR
jgi:hypothetical protein